MNSVVTPVKISKALADETRLRIFEAISATDHINSSEIVSMRGVSPATVSHHLKILSEAGLIICRSRQSVGRTSWKYLDTPSARSDGSLIGEFRSLQNHGNFLLFKIARKLVTVGPEQAKPYRRLLLLPKHLSVGLAIRIKAITFTLFASGFQFGPSNVPVRTAFLQYRTQVLPKLFNGRSAKKPVAIVDLEYNETRFEDDDMRDHWIVIGVRVLRDVEVLLNPASRIG